MFCRRITRCRALIALNILVWVMVNSSSIFANSSSKINNSKKEISTNINEKSVQKIGPIIVVDQFGYLVDSEKIAVIRVPEKGFDAPQNFKPGDLYQVIESETKLPVFSAPPVAWNNGKIDESSGDRAFWIDFTALKKPGSYYIYDKKNNLFSYKFSISNNVYDQVLSAAVRTFFYQRAGCEKSEKFVGKGWADKASHLGPNQDKNARKYDKKRDSSTELNLSGGWYDAGDFNKYSSWTARTIINLLQAYEENPKAFGDDLNILESQNGIPDILDEVKWGMDWLIKMQEKDGSVLSIVGLSSASPPSTAEGASYYGDASTSASLNVAAAFAYGSTIFGKQNNQLLAKYADELRWRAALAFEWAQKNPNVQFRNNEGKSKDLGAGQQETDDNGRAIAKLMASLYLFQATKDEKYNRIFIENTNKTNLLGQRFASPFEHSVEETLLYYTKLPGADRMTKEKVLAEFNNSMSSEHLWQSFMKNNDPYLAYIKDYTWGSNQTKAWQGLMFYNFGKYSKNSLFAQTTKSAAERYLHYLHGVNPLGIVYLSNMNSLGAENSITQIFHAWFTDGSPKWDKAGESEFGPAPGFLAGGPNPGYDWDGCCPNQCGGSKNNQKCRSESLQPPKGQPAQKSYKDFNTSWPLNSWSVSENANGYQAVYIRLLSLFVLK